MPEEASSTTNASRELPELDASFPRRYEAQARGWLEAADDFRYFPARPALTVAVKPEGGSAWTGAFGEHGAGATRSR